MRIFLSSCALGRDFYMTQRTRAESPQPPVLWKKKNILKQLLIFLDKRIFNHLLIFLGKVCSFNQRLPRSLFVVFPAMLSYRLVSFHNFVKFLLQELATDKPQTKQSANGTKFIFTRQCSCIKFKPLTVMEQTIPKTLTFKKRLSAKMSLICMTKKIYFNINSFARIQL